MSAGVVAALAAEARTLGPPARRSRGLLTLGDGTLLRVSGMGPAAAAAAARSLIEAGASALVSWGMAGGLDPALRAGAICLPVAVMSRTGTSLVTDHHWRELASAGISARRVVVGGSLLTSPVAIDDVAGKAAAFRETGAVAVDMESMAVAEVAAGLGLPFIAVRVIVDTAGDALPAAVINASRGGEVHVLRLIQGLLRSPRELAALLRLAGRYRLARGALRAVARTGALAPLTMAGPAGTRVA